MLKLIILAEAVATAAVMATILHYVEKRRKAERQMRRNHRLSEHTKKRVAAIEADAAR